MIGFHASHEQAPDGIYVHHVGQQQSEFIEAFGNGVLLRLAA